MGLPQPDQLLVMLHAIPAVSFPVVGQRSFYAFADKRWLDWTQIWWTNSLSFVHAPLKLFESFPLWFNSLVPGGFKWKFRLLISKLISAIDDWGISCEIARRWLSLDLTDDKSTLVQVMAWCHQATSHYLDYCWPSSLLPYGVTRPQWVNPQQGTCIHWCLIF